MKKFIPKRVFAMVLVVVFTCTMPAIADWASAESADFSIDTTPEPCISLFLLCCAVVLAARRRNSGI
jgi:hypothetical protein